MKSLIIASILFLTVIVFVCINFFVLNNFFDRISGYLEALPQSSGVLEEMPEEQTEQVFRQLDRILSEWKSYETYICLSMDHNVSRKFLEYFIPAVSYFESGDYPSFLAQAKNAYDMLDHMKFDESLKFGNLL